MRRWLVLLFVSLPAQAFWYTAAGGVVGSWAGMQYGELVAQVQVSQAAAASVLPTAPPLPVAYAAEFFTATPTPRPTVRPTQTPRPLPPGRLPDRQPAVSPFVFAKR